jgi:hypothetical protein
VEVRRRQECLLNPEEIPPKAATIFGAHGDFLAIVEEARRKNLQIIDATCPLVAKLRQFGANRIVAAEAPTATMTFALSGPLLNERNERLLKRNLRTAFHSD